MDQKNDRNEKGRVFIIILITIALIIILLSILVPMMLTQYFSWMHFSEKTGQIGDTLGGIMNPFVALSSVIITFLAFYIQYKANLLQRILFRQELDTNKFENQFYEMLRLHKENVSELFIAVDGNNVTGRSVFKYFIDELKIAYSVAKHIYPNREPNYWINKAYYQFFNGFDFERPRVPRTREGKLERKYILTLVEIEDGNMTSSDAFQKEITKYDLKIEWLKFKLFRGQSFLLGHYYRHLFQTVKFIVDQKEEFISYPEKRNYLRILRAQLSDHEQALLFYNWKAGFGSSWENETNKFFTDYRMIHNINNTMIFKDFNLTEIFRLDHKRYYRVEDNRKKDSLFEFQDWE